MRHLFIAALFALLPISAASHSKVDKTDPADGAILDTASDEIVFAVAMGLRMTKAELHSDGGDTDLELSKQKGYGTDLSVPLELSGPGAYQTEWRGLSVDGHTATDSVSFTLE